MNPVLYWLCGKAMGLNAIPGYQRYWRMTRDMDEHGDRIFKPEPREWRRHGQWGFWLLNRLHLMDKMMDEYDRRHPWEDNEQLS
jgi:hypothetical protein